MDTVEVRAARHAALGDPVRLRIVDTLALTDLAPVELGRRLGIESNLLAHHLDVLDDVGLVVRTRSSGDGRRRYVHLLRAVVDSIGVRPHLAPSAALFVCTGNSARSQLAAAVWRSLVDAPASSAGTHPADRVHPAAVAAARRAGLDLTGARPAALATVRRRPPLVVTVCDRAHEELGAPEGWLHWSIPDPVPTGTNRAFDRTVDELRDRVRDVVAAA